MGKLTSDQIKDAALEGWSGGPAGIYAGYATGDFNAGVRFVSAIAEAADQADHHPDVLLSYPSVQIRLVSHDVGAVTERDVRLASTIHQIATTQGIDPAADTDDVKRLYGTGSDD